MIELAEAIVLVDAVAGKVIRVYDRAGMGSAVQHALVGAVMAGVRFETEVDVWVWLAANTGMRALRVYEEAARR